MKIKLLFLLLIISINSLTAQDAIEKRVLSLEDCINIALEKNFDIKLSSSQKKLADADAKVAGGAYLPSANMSMSYNRHLNAQDGGPISYNIGGQVVTTPGSKAVPNSFSLNAFTNFTIFDGFNRENNYERSHKNQEYTDKALLNTIEKTKFDIYKQFVNITRNAQIVKIRQENMTQGQADLDRLRALLDAGTIPINNVYAQEAELGNREFDLVRSENDFNNSKAILLSLMGIKPDLDYDFKLNSIPENLTDNEIKEFKLKIGSFGSALDKAIQTRYDIQSSNSSVEMAKLGVSMSQAAYLPSLNASGGWNWNNTELTAFDIGRSYFGLSLSVPLFDQYRTSYQVESSNFQLQQATINRNQLEQSIRTSLKSGFLNLEAAIKQLEITKKSIVSAEKNYESSKERFNVGTSNITDFTLANTNFVTAKINRISAVYNFLSVKRELEFNIGNY